MNQSTKNVEKKENQDTLGLFRRVLHSEAEALQAGADRAGDEIEAAVGILRNTVGRVVFTGLGKAGYVAHKGAATFCSTGTPAIFLHPTEALHGDIGVVAKNDTLIAISNSGETDEVLAILPFMARLGVPIIAITGNKLSSLAKRSTVTIDSNVTHEADPISVAPTSSTTLQMAICDALAVTLMTERGFTREQFAIFHPGGSLGRKLLLRVVDLMRVGDNLPIISHNLYLHDAVEVITAKKMGAVFVVDEQRKVIGILTDGDLRRWYQKQPPQHSPHSRDVDSMFDQLLPASSVSRPSPSQRREGATSSDNPPVMQVMTVGPKQILVEALAAEALKLMEDNQITVLPVVDKDGCLVGAIHLHDLIRAGLA
jgi:arabinose-5-phosphate isomerase